MALIERGAGLRPGPLTTPLAAAKHALRALARRWQLLQVEIRQHERHLTILTESVAPAMVAAFGIGADTAAEMLIVAGDNPEGFILRRRGPNSAASVRPPPAAA